MDVALVSHEVPPMSSHEDFKRLRLKPAETRKQHTDKHCQTPGRPRKTRELRVEPTTSQQTVKFSSKKKKRKSMRKTQPEHCRQPDKIGQEILSQAEVDKSQRAHRDPR